MSGDETETDPIDAAREEGFQAGRLNGFRECLSLGFGHGQHLAHQAGFHAALAEAMTALMNLEEADHFPATDARKRLADGAQALVAKAETFPLDVSRLC
jgi:hypothetical protein